MKNIRKNIKIKCVGKMHGKKLSRNWNLRNRPWKIENGPCFKIFLSLFSSDIERNFFDIS